MKFYHGKLALDVPATVYYPMEDSLFLAKLLEKKSLVNKKVLDMGCGSGFLSIIMAKGKAQVTGADISRDAVKATNNNAERNNVSVTCIQSDLFSVINGTFDLIVFNPPYLPEGADAKYLGKEKSHLVGGKTGREVVEKFIKQAKSHLNNGGKILLLISSLTGEEEVIDTFNKHGFRTRVLDRQKIPWEELMVIEACIQPAFSTEL